MALVQSVIRRLPNSLYPVGRIHYRTHGHRWSLLKVRKEKYRQAWWGPCRSGKLRELVSALHVLLKPMITYGEGRRRRFPSNNQ
jgi:hypothetical protein